MKCPGFVFIAHLCCHVHRLCCSIGQPMRLYSLWLLKQRMNPLSIYLENLFYSVPFDPSGYLKLVPSTKSNDISLHTPAGLSCLKRSSPSITVSLFTQSVTEQMATHQESAPGSLAAEGLSFFFCPPRHSTQHNSPHWNVLHPCQLQLPARLEAAVLKKKKIVMR